MEESSRSRVKALTDAWRCTEAATAAAAAAAGRGGRGQGGGSTAGGGGAAETAAIHKDLPVLATVMAQEGGGGEEVAATVGWPRQLRLLLVRSWRQVVRDRATIVSRAVANVSRCAGQGGRGGEGVHWAGGRWCGTGPPSSRGLWQMSAGGRGTSVSCSNYFYVLPRFTFMKCLKSSHHPVGSGPPSRYSAPLQSSDT